MTEFSIHKVWIIAKREYLERVKTRSFLLSTFATPVLMGAFLVLPAMISESMARGIVRDSERPARVVIASDNRALAEVASGELMRQQGTRYEPSVGSPASPAEHEQLDKRVDAATSRATCGSTARRARPARRLHDQSHGRLHS